MRGLILAPVVALASTAAQAGTLVAFGDEWALSDAAYNGGWAVDGDAAATTVLADNLSALIGSGDYLIASTNSYAYGPVFAAQMADNGNTVTRSATLAGLAGYDAVFLAGPVGSGATNAAALSQFIDAGGSVVVSLGTGKISNAASEAAAWQPLLGSYGISAATSWSYPKYGPHLSVVPGAGPLDDGLTGVAWSYGNEVWADGTNAYAYSAITAQYGADDRRVAAVYDNTAPAVPLPAGLPLALTGFGALAILRRR